MNQTLNIAQNTIELLESQTHKINNLENNIENIDETLTYSEYLLNKMSSILFNIFNKNLLFNQSKDKDLKDQSKDKDLKDQSKDKDLDKSLDISNDLENLKNLNVLISDHLDLHNEKLTNLNEKIENTNIKTLKLNKSIRKLTY